MRKKYWSKISWLILGLVPLLLIACGGGAVATTEPVPATDEPVAPTAAPVLEESQPETVDVVEEPEAEMVEEAEAEMSDEILPVSAKPQLIEFYADW